MAEIAETPGLSAREIDAFAPPDIDQWRAIFAPFLKARPDAAAILSPSLEQPRRALEAMNRICRLSRACGDAAF